MKRIIGAGGGKPGGGGGGISESPDTLSSVALVRFIDLIGEGPIKGLVNGEKSIYLDGVPMRDELGRPSYKPFRWKDTLGTPNQGVLPGFSGSQSETVVGLKLLKSQGRTVRSVPDEDADAVRVTLSVAGLSETTSDGKVNGAVVEYSVFARPVGGEWRLMKKSKIEGKSRSRYQRSHDVPLTALGPGPYEIGVERLTDDSASALLINDLYWDSFTIINLERLTYPNSALLGMELDARYFSQIPPRSYHVEGLLIRVPRNYDPQTRVYRTTGPGTTNGAWDGTFIKAYSNNPAWCYYDLVLNKRYGLGRRVAASQVDKWQIYEIGKYCDGLVPTGNNFNVFEANSSSTFNVGSKPSVVVPLMNNHLEPRFTLNCVINTPQAAYKLLNALSSVFRGMTYWSSGFVSLTQDRPTEPSKIFNNANVKGGIFKYEGSSRAQRNTTVTVAWNDPKEGFLQKFEYVEDRAGISRYGIRPTEIVAFGCTSQSQARRAGLWLLYTQRLESEAVTFTTGLEGSDVAPGETLTIMDGRRVGARMGGRIMASTVNDITIDAPLHLTMGAYTLYTMSHDGTVVTKSVNIEIEGDYSVLPVSVPYTVAPRETAMWSMASTAVVPMQVRVVSNRALGQNQYELMCLQNVPEKYDAIEKGGVVIAPNYTLLSATTVPDVTGLVAVEHSFKPRAGLPTQTNLEVTWDALTEPMVRGYEVKLVGPDKVVHTLPETRDAFILKTNVTPGAWKIRVNAVNHFGTPGKEDTFTLTVLGKDVIPPAAVSQGSLTYQIDYTTGVHLDWGPVEDFIQGYAIRKGGTSWGSAKSAGFTSASQFNLGFVKGTEVYRIKSLDTSGNYSVAEAAINVTVPAPVLGAVSFRLIGPDGRITWALKSSSLAIEHFIVKKGWDFTTAVVQARVKSLSWDDRIDFGGVEFFWIQAVDLGGNVSAPKQVTVSIIPPSPVPMRTPSVVDNNVLLRWSKPTEGNLPLAYYEIYKGSSVEAGELVGTKADATFATFFETLAGTYTYWLLAYDTAGNTSEPVSVMATVAEPPDYVLQVNHDFSFAGAKSNMYVEGGALLGPVLTSETASQHFSTNGWTTADQQNAAGFPLYAQPSTVTGTYEETYDFGAALASSTVQVLLNRLVLDGTVTVSCQLYSKLNIGDSWIAAATGVTSALIQNFRYVRTVWTFTCPSAGANLIRVTGFNLRISNKLRSDSGKATITNANAGVWVPFNVAFADAETPVCQAVGTVPLIPIVDFADVPNPTGFTAYLHNPTSGVKVTGSFSWRTRGR